MKIASQNLILIAPIFLVLAVITAFVLFVSERREVRWGLDSEAQGVALAIAEFTRASTLTPLPGETSKDREARLRPPIDRVLKFGHARRVELFVLEAGQPRRVLDIGERAGTPPSIDPDTLDRVIDGAVPIDDAPGATDRQAAYAPIRTGSQVHGIVVVEASLVPLFEHRHEIIFGTAAIAVGLLGIGCLVSLIISRIISGEIGRLTRTAEAFVAGAYDARLERGAIEEVAVVGSTFGIMGSVLKDATLRSTREMVQLERFSTEMDLGVSFAERFAQPVAEERGGLSVAIDRIGPPMHGDFWLVQSIGEDHVACLGRVAGAPSFKSMVAASATATLIEAMLAGGATPERSLEQATELGPLERGILARWRTGAADRVTVWQLKSGERVERSSVELGPGRIRVFTTLEEEFDARATRFADAYTFATARQAVEELRQFAGAEVSGGVLAIHTGERH